MKQGCALARDLGFDRLLVCDEDNAASQKVVLRNGGRLEDQRCDGEEQVLVRRYWIEL